MKVGTDGVLLGAWANANPDILRIADIGAGSGLVSIMLAQRFTDAHIDAIEIDQQAATQANDNFLSSPWSNRLNIFCSPVQQFAPSHIAEYDLIVSNPPFFSNSMKAPDQARTTARHTDTLTLNQLISCAATMLKTNGTLCLVLPAWEETNILQCAAQSQLQLCKLCRVQGRATKPAKRLLLSFLKTTKETAEPENTVIEENLILEDEPNKRTIAYSQLMHDFYL